MPLETNTKFIFSSINHVSGLLLFCSHPALSPSTDKEHSAAVTDARGEQSSWGCWQDSQGLSELLLWVIHGQPCHASSPGCRAALPLLVLHLCRHLLQLCCPGLPANRVPAPCGAGERDGTPPNGFSAAPVACHPACSQHLGCCFCTPDIWKQLLWDSVLLRLNTQPSDKHLQKEEFPLWDGLAYELKQANALKSILGCC